MLTSPAVSSQEYSFNTSKPRLEKYIITDQEENTKHKEMLHIHLASEQPESTKYSFVYSSVVLCHGVCVQSNKCLHSYYEK